MRCDCRQGKAVEAASLPISQARKHLSRSDGSEEAIRVCYDLLLSGQSLPVILVALKRLGPLNKTQFQPRGAYFDARSSDLPGERRSAIDYATPPVEANLSLALSQVPQSQLLPRNGEKQSNKNGRGPIGTAVFWFIPAMCLTLMAGAGKLLIDAALNKKSEILTVVTEATASRDSSSAIGNIATQKALDKPAAARRDETVAVPLPAEPMTPAIVTGTVRLQPPHPLANGKSTRESAMSTNSRSPANRASSARSSHTENN
jgi:hypothetical protein